VNASAGFLVVVGLRAKTIKEGALEAGMNAENIFEFQNSREAGEFLEKFTAEEDLVFIKGSQSMRMERAVEKILLDKKNKAKFLVRQDKEWLAKE
jgi:UDP-N-acetylmuramoyl-tripeptide--D-alanyl-D-alanine ligase